MAIVRDTFQANDVVTDAVISVQLVADTFVINDLTNDAPLLADGVVPLDDVCPSIRWSTLVTAESTTEPSSDSEVPSVPSSTVAVLKMLAATTGVVAFGRVAR